MKVKVYYPETVNGITTTAIILRARKTDDISLEYLDNVTEIEPGQDVYIFVTSEIPEIVAKSIKEDGAFAELIPNAMVALDFYHHGKPASMPIEYAMDDDYSKWGIETKGWSKLFTTDSELSDPHNIIWDRLLDFFDDKYRELLDMGVSKIKENGDKV